MIPTPLISTAELAEHLDHVRVLDARYGPDARAAYAKEHLRGAVYADLDRDLSQSTGSAARGGRHPLPPIDVWAAKLGEWGIGPETPVVVYDDQGGALAAARAWWMLRASGHPAVAVVDGGWQAIREAGLPIDAETPSIEARPPYPVEKWHLPTVDADAVDRIRRDDSCRVVDVRAPERYRGEVEPFDPIAGHIPGAINVPYAGSLDAAGRFKSPDALRAALEEALSGVTPDRVVVHCGSGVTACHTLLAMERAGIPGAALYVGSWSEWSATDRDKATGC